MNNPSPDNQTENEAVAVQPQDPRRRLRELLSVPERDRSDEQWDEIIELEIQLAPGNRVSPNEQIGGGGGAPRSSGANKGGGGVGQQKKHRPRTNNNTRRPRQPKTGGGSTGGAAPAA